ncbi:MAG: succinate dehydrogenase/fumarate reductase iron-sulfur subunit [Spirochaetales bacterium]|nr:succinate dehydrogenase/fumarate reductase iron-sulfur subunit [Spirochaetales bacterium]
MIAKLSVARGDGRVELEVEAPEWATVLDALEIATSKKGTTEARRHGGREKEGEGQKGKEEKGTGSGREWNDVDVLYRHSCHHGSCGVCGALVNGRPALMCRTPLRELPSGVVRLDPLPYATVIADLAVEPGPLFDSLPGFGYLRPPAREELPPVPDPAPLPGAPAERPRERFEDCIECGLCLAACPVLVPEGAEGSDEAPDARRPFVGPAALAMARRELAKKGPLSGPARTLAAAPDGVAACDRAFECSRVCPRGVAPGRLIEELRRGT